MKTEELNPKNNLKNGIIRLRLLGKSYGQISKELGCTKSTAHYHTIKNKRFFNQRFHEATVTKLFRRYKSFIGSGGNKNRKNKIKKNSDPEKLATFSQIITKIENYPFCEMTGIPININNLESYSFDHKIPISRGGSGSYENFNLVCRQVDQMKKNYSLDEFKNLCKLISNE